MHAVVSSPASQRRVLSIKNVLKIVRRGGDPATNENIPIIDIILHRPTGPDFWAPSSDINGIYRYRSVHLEYVSL